MTREEDEATSFGQGYTIKLLQCRTVYFHALPTAAGSVTSPPAAPHTPIHLNLSSTNTISLSSLPFTSILIGFRASKIFFTEIIRLHVAHMCKPQSPYQQFPL